MRITTTAMLAAGCYWTPPLRWPRQRQEHRGTGRCSAHSSRALAGGSSTHNYSRCSVRRAHGRQARPMSDRRQRRWSTTRLIVALLTFGTRGSGSGTRRPERDVARTSHLPTKCAFRPLLFAVCPVPQVPGAPSARCHGLLCAGSGVTTC
jgi:hypothetical protein